MFSAGGLHRTSSMHQMHQLRHTRLAPALLECGKKCLDPSEPHFPAVFSLFLQENKTICGNFDAVSSYYIIVIGAQQISWAKRKYEY